MLHAFALILVVVCKSTHRTMEDISPKCTLRKGSLAHPCVSRRHRLHRCRIPSCHTLQWKFWDLTEYYVIIINGFDFQTTGWTIRSIFCRKHQHRQDCLEKAGSSTRINSPIGSSVSVQWQRWSVVAAETSKERHCARLLGPVSFLEDKVFLVVYRSAIAAHQTLEASPF